LTDWWRQQRIWVISDHHHSTNEHERKIGKHIKPPTSLG
jgi:hypothetical protein